MSLVSYDKKGGEPNQHLVTLVDESEVGGL